MAGQTAGPSQAKLCMGVPWDPGSDIGRVEVGSDLEVMEVKGIRRPSDGPLRVKEAPDQKTS